MSSEKVQRRMARIAGKRLAKHFQKADERAERMIFNQILRSPFDPDVHGLTAGLLSGEYVDQMKEAACDVPEA